MAPGSELRWRGPEQQPRLANHVRLVSVPSPSSDISVRQPTEASDHSRVEPLNPLDLLQSEAHLGPANVTQRSRCRATNRAKQTPHLLRGMAQDTHESVHILEIVVCVRGEPERGAT